MADEGNLHLQKLVNQFLQSLIANWDEELVFLTESLPTNHWFITDQPFFSKYGLTFSRFESTASNLHQLVESFLELLPYPDAVNGQPRNVEEPESWFNEFKTAINERHPKCTPQSLDESLAPILGCCVSKMILIILSAHHTDGDSSQAADVSDELKSDSALKKNIQSMCISKVELEATTVSWIIAVFQNNLEKAVKKTHFNPLLDAYASRALLYWSKVVGLLSMRAEDEIISIFRQYLNEQKNPQSISAPAMFYFAALRYVRVTPQNQEKYLNFFLPYLQHQHRKTPDSVISSLLLTLCNVFRQCDFVNTDDKTLVLKLAEINELLKRLAEKKKLLKPVKKQVYITNICFLLRAPQGLFRTLAPFLEKRCISHLDESDKCEQCLDMLIYLLQGTYDPFLSFFQLKVYDKNKRKNVQFYSKNAQDQLPKDERRKSQFNNEDGAGGAGGASAASAHRIDNVDDLLFLADIDWTSRIRHQESEHDIQDRIKHLFKALVRKNVLKLMRSTRHWKKLIFVMTKLMAQDLEYGMSVLLPQLIDSKRGGPLTMELALDVISEMLRPNGTFNKYHAMSKTTLDTLTGVLPAILDECEAAIGNSRLHKRETPLLLHYDGHYIERYRISADPTNREPSIEDFNAVLRINMEDAMKEKAVQSAESGQVLDEEEKEIYDEEKGLLDDIQYKQIRDAQLLSLSFLQNDVLGAKILQLRQKHRGYDDIELAVKNNKGAKKEYLNVLRACIRCILSLRPNGVLTDCGVKNLTYIGRYLLHQDYEVVLATYAVLRNIVKQEKMLLSSILTGLTNYLLQFYIHRAPCIAILIQTISGLVSTFIESHSIKEILRDRGIVDDLCFAFNRLDALAFAFFCHTNLYVRYSCINLTLSVAKGLKIIIAHYFADQSPEEQQRQLTFPASLGNLFQLYSADIIKRARRKYFIHRDNMDKTSEPFDQYFNEHYIQTVENISHEGILKMLLVQDDYTPAYACVDAIVEKIESLCLDGSIYFRFLRVDSCQEILLQENWLGVDEQSKQSEILQSMCVALVCLVGFSDNGMDDVGFYDSIWKQLERFSHVDDVQLVHTVLYALQSAHFTRVANVYESLDAWFHDSFEKIPVKLKKKHRKRMFQDNCVRVWLRIYVVLSLTGTDRLFEAFLSELKLIQQLKNNNEDVQKRDEQHKKLYYLHAGLIAFCNEINTEHILKHTNADPEVLRSVARIVENVAITLFKVYQRTGYDWVLRLWSAQDRASLLSVLCVWSECSNENAQGKFIADSIRAHRTKLKDKEADRKEEKKVLRRIKRIEIQANRAATALLCLGPALDPHVIVPNGDDDGDEDYIDDEKEDDSRSDYGSVYSRRSQRPKNRDLAKKAKQFTWFVWAINAQKEGVPALKYLMKNHYSRMLKYVLATLYAEQSRGAFDHARIYFDVITSLDLPGEDDDEDFNAIEIIQRLVSFCLMYLVPFVPHQLIQDAQPHSHHRRDESSIITFRGVPVDNFGANYAVSLPSAMQPAVVHQIQTSKLQSTSGKSCYNRPRLLSPACVQSMGRGTHMDKLMVNRHGKVVVELVDDIMQAIDMSRKTFSLFYKVVLLIAETSGNVPTLDKLHELRMGLQSNDLRDVRQNASAISWVFASVCDTDLAISITDEILNTLESYAERIETLEDRGQLSDTAPIHDQITMISNFLQVSLPWFVAAPLHQRKQDTKEACLDKILSLTLRFQHFKKPEIDNAFFRIWHVLVTANDTMLSSPEAENIDYTIRFLVMTVCGRYQGYSEDMAKIERLEQEAMRYESKNAGLNGHAANGNGKRKKRSVKRMLSKKKRSDDVGAEYQGPTLEELHEFRKETLKPEQFISLCESIIKQIFATHPECVMSTLLQLISVGCGLGGHVLENDDHVQVKRPGQAYVDSSYQLGGSKYSLLVTEIAIRWFMSLATKSFNKIQQCLPVLMVHCILFLTRGFENMSNVPAEFISHLFVSLLPPKLGIDDEVIQIALWLRDRRTYQFKWSEELINNIEPEKSRLIHKELANAFEDNDDVYRPFDLRRFFAQQNIVYIDDLVRILFNCYRHRYGNREAAVWGIRALQWATVDVDKEEETTVYFARIMASRALRLFCIISEPKTVRSVSMILKSILTGLRASEQFWRRKELEEDGVQKYSQEDMHLSMAIRGIEALVAMVRTEEWNRTLFRMMLVAFWIALSLLQCRIARIQIAARRLLRTTLQHRPWLVYLFGQAKNADGSNLKKGSISLEMFWSFYKLFENDFGGIQERVISALIFSIGDDAPVTLNTDTMMILCCVWLIRCDVLHDRNISSRLAANLSFFLPYACALLGENYFQSNNIDQHMSGHRPDDDDDGVHGMSAIPILNDMDDDDDDLKTGMNDVDGEAFSGKELRDKYDNIFRLRKENARIFKTLALYIQQNVIKEEKGKPAVRLAEIDINDKNALSQFPMPDWSKINRNFRQTYVGIYDVVSHIATALMASWTMNEPSTLLALGDFCQYLIDVFIPSNAATLANVFSICLLIGDEYLKIGTIKALQLFVPRLFKQCKTMEIFQPVIACFDETFERCTHLTLDENERVSQCAHQFIFELTSNGYKAFNTESKLMRSMYPSFREVNTNDDGMATTIADLSKILRHTEQLLQQYPDQQTVSAKLDRLLHMKPKDGSMSHNQNQPAQHQQPKNVHLNPNPKSAQQQQPPQQQDVVSPPDAVLSPPPPSQSQQLGAPLMPDIRRQSQMHQPPEPRSEQPALKNQPSFIQNKNDPMQHNAMKTDKDKIPQRLVMKPVSSILPEDEENDEGPANMVESPRFSSRPPGAKHRDLLSQVTVLSLAEDNNVNVNVMNMGSYRDLRIDRTMTIENLEKTVDKQMQNVNYNHNQPRPSGVAMGGKYNKFGSGPLIENDGDDQKQQSSNAMPFGMSDTRPKYMQQKAAAMQQQQNGHHKVPTFGASGRDLRQEMASAPDDDDEEEEDDEDELESEPQKFPSYQSNQNSAPVNMSSPVAYNNEANVPARPAPVMMMNETQPGMGGEGGDESDDHNNGNDGNSQQSMNSAAPQKPSAVINTITVNLSPRKQPMTSPVNMDNIPIMPGAHQNVPVGDLSTFLDDTALLRTFLKFLKKKTDDYKLLEFYLMAGQFKTHAQDPKSTFSAQRNNAKLIIETFFLPDSKKFLEKIGGMTRHEAMSQFLTAGKSSSFPATLFDRARQEVKSELISRVFPIFMQSDRYKKLVDEGKIRPP
eukprot:CAMPEP_0202694492 /NCGR_PEP_ID=MMETSP1385-20130828/8341_1 /ASSEMBLY_ACC=CAM_ASM_000861 /TAXON_ID=933848 /ORGANISM="Elphidium margaritaceum" /LENGTH=3200 /DNA_ID=CAMNT_0049350349 /DNA_START=31 /DNA_END=9633 /DNA_ORIENTATION=+